jgi:ribosomal protein L31E
MANTKSKEPVKIQGNILEEVESFTYLGSVVDKTGGTDADVKTRIGKARTAFVMLGKIWKTNNISTATKIRIFNSNVKSVLLYGAETWKTTKTMLKKIQAFVNRCLRRILHIWWPNKITNEELWRKTNEKPILEQIRSRKWGWIGHTLRKPRHSTTRQALLWNPQGKRKRGRPRNTWRRETEAEMENAGYTWKQLETVAQNKTRWRGVVSGTKGLKA